MVRWAVIYYSHLAQLTIETDETVNCEMGNSDFVLTERGDAYRNNRLVPNGYYPFSKCISDPKGREFIDKGAQMWKD